jgi:protein involved in polysaccharide export with SLBB domain
MTPEQAQRLLQQRPELGEVVRQRLAESGMTPEQIRARLRAAGYPGGLLDAYLTTDTLVTAFPRPDQAMVEAIGRLGLASWTRQDSLLLAGDSLALKVFQDSLRADSIAREDTLKVLRRGLPLFGLDVFRQAGTRFIPIVSGPVDDAYVLGPGDVLVLILTGAVEDAHTLEVTRAGFVVIPRVGQLHVNNLTLGQLRELLYQRLGRVYSGVTRSPDARTRFDITVASVRIHTVRVVGEVARPGSYQVPATGSVLTALYEAGGVTGLAGFRNVQVRRGARLVTTVDLYDYLLHGIVPNTAPLASGDVIFVPVQGARVKVVGEVRRPAVYEVKPGETIRDAIRIAGGLTPLASVENATIDRILPGAERLGPGRERTVLTVSLRQVLDSAGPAPALTAGDSVTVFAIGGPRRDAVTVRGAVWQPGTYSLRDGMRLSDLLAVAGGVRPEAYEGRAQVVRTGADSTRLMFGAELGAAGTPGAADNPELQERDEVTIFSRTEYLPERYVAVMGAVNRPGRVRYADSMTLRDAILLAGGVTQDAYLGDAEVSRLRRERRPGDSLAVVLETPLDSSYMLIPDGSAARAGQDGPRVVLEPFDHVFVHQRPGWERPRTVVLTGQVQLPGPYALLTEDEPLSSVIQRAGGLTPDAYAGGIRFFRREAAAGGLAVRPDSVTGARPADRLPSLSRDTTTHGTAVTPVRQLRIGVDLPRVLRNASHRDNVVLADGDSVHIPGFNPVVRVEGAVNAPGAVTYAAGASLEYYVQAAGGYSQLAYRRGRYILQPNGHIVKSGSPGAGATVVVPEKVQEERRVDPTSIIALVAQVISATATVLVVALTR